MRVCVFFFFFSRDGHPPLAFGVVCGLSTLLSRLFRDYCLTMRIKRGINVHSAKCDRMFLQLANYRASRASECRTYFKLSSDSCFIQKRNDRDIMLHIIATHMQFLKCPFIAMLKAFCALITYVITQYIFIIFVIR